MDKDTYRSEIQLSLHARVRKALENPDISIEEKKQFIKVIRPEHREFFIKTLSEEAQKLFNIL